MTGPLIRERSVWLVDTTLRDGEQAPGLCFTARQRLDIAGALSGGGIDELELGVSAREGKEWHEPTQLLDRGVTAILTSWCRLKPEDVECALSTEVQCVHVAVPASVIQLGIVGISRTTCIDRMRRCVGMALEKGRIVSVGAVDASRAEPSWLEDLVGLTSNIGASRFRLADTVGVLTPFTAQALVRRLRRAAPKMTIGFHAHNDLGLATANSLAAVYAGASALDVTVGGLGERAGNAALEQIVMALHVTGYGSTSFDRTLLPKICKIVASAANRSISPAAPIVGEHVFCHSSGIHVDGIVKNPLAFEPFAPEACGRSRTLTVDAHSGKSALRLVVGNTKAQSGNSVDLTALAATMKRRGANGQSVDPVTLRELIQGDAVNH